MRDLVLDYLIRSGFVKYYVKKLMFPSDINDLFDDYVQEVWLQLCEVSEEKWESLYDKRPEQDDFYDIRNFVSVIIRNTVRSTTSAAYRKLKKPATVMDGLDSEQWKEIENTVEDGGDVIQTIKNSEPAVS